MNKKETIEHLNETFNLVKNIDVETAINRI